MCIHIMCMSANVYVCAVTTVEYIYLLPHYVDVVFLNQFNLQPRRHSWDKAKPVSDIFSMSLPLQYHSSNSPVNTLSLSFSLGNATKGLGGG